VSLDLALTWEGHRVRMVGTPEAPLWIAVDVCAALELREPNPWRHLPDAAGRRLRAAAARQGDRAGEPVAGMEGNHRERGTHEGTRWVPLGEGSSIAALLDQSGEGSASEEERGHKTDLLLTGQPLGSEDHRRIRHTVDLARKRAAGAAR